MTEKEWLACAEPKRMLEFLWGKTSDRKLRLYTAACCRRTRHMLPEDATRNGVEVIERYADGRLSSSTMDKLRRQLTKAHKIDSEPRRWTAQFSALRALAYSLFPKLTMLMLTGSTWSADALAMERLPESRERGNARFQKVYRTELIALVGLVNDIFGPLPFREVSVRPSCLTSTVLSLAQNIYDEDTFDRLPVLADALEEAGCTTAEVLAHCRGSGPHVRGCWVVDLLLGKE